MALALSGLVLAAGARLTDADPAHPPVWLMAAATGITHALVLALVHWFLRVQHQTWQDGFGFFSSGWPRHLGRAILWTVPALIGALLLHQGCVLLFERMGLSTEAQAAVEAARRAGSAWEQTLLAVTAVVSAPFIEEILFRGVLWPMARSTAYPRVGAVAVSLLFALIHFNAPAVLPLCALGLFWIWLYERTGNLLAPIASHALFNALNLAWLMLSSGEVPT